MLQQETWYTGTGVRIKIQRHTNRETKYTRAYTETSYKLVQTRDMVYRHRHGTQVQTKGRHDVKAHKQGDMIYTGTYRDMEHTFTY